MTLRGMLVALSLITVSAGIVVGVIAWEPWNGNGGSGDFSITVRTDADFKEAARLLESFMPDFNCSGDWDEEVGRGSLGCAGGENGFQCTFSSVAAEAGLFCLALSESPVGSVSAFCNVEGDPVSGQFNTQCSGPNTDTSCEMRTVAEAIADDSAPQAEPGPTVTCQRF